jgi:uncharacterized cofD-like protein
MEHVLRKIVVVGGGTGTHTVLKGLKAYEAELSLTAIVSMADSGGSTGRLRDEFGQLPAGDVRNALVALAASGDTHDELLRQLFLYRFTRGEGLYGHNFGNLFLTVLTDILGSEVAAIEAASRILRVSGRVVPVTTDHAHLRAVYADGGVIVGEHGIDEWQDSSRREVRITELSLTPKASINPAAAAALREADMVILGPGDLYTSLLANCVVDGFVEALQASQGTFVYVCNLMSKAGQTIGLHAREHVAEVTKYAGKAPAVMLYNNSPLPAEIVAKYYAEGDHPVLNNCSTEGETKILALPLLASEVIKTVTGDTLTRSLIRHDSEALALVIRNLLSEHYPTV